MSERPAVTAALVLLFAALAASAVTPALSWLIGAGLAALLLSALLVLLIRSGSAHRP